MGMETLTLSTGEVITVEVDRSGDYIGGWAEIARKYWRENLPEFYDRLVMERDLEWALGETQSNMDEGMGRLMESGLRRDEAMEIMAPRHIYLTPEAAETFRLTLNV